MDETKTYNQGKKDWRGEKGKYYDYGKKDGIKDERERIIGIIDNRIKVQKDANKLYQNLDGHRQTFLFVMDELEFIKQKISQDNRT